MTIYFIFCLPCGVIRSIATFNMQRGGWAGERILVNYTQTLEGRRQPKPSPISRSVSNRVFGFHELLASKSAFAETLEASRLRALLAKIIWLNEPIWIMRKVESQAAKRVRAHTRECVYTFTHSHSQHTHTRAKPYSPVLH